jgi:MIP family channel proteins
MPVRLGGALLVEFVGTFGLCLSAILALHNSDANWLPVALTTGLIVAAMVSAATHTSGGHLNPAVTLGLLVAGRMKPVAALSYIVIQLLGGVVASLAVYVMFGGGAAAARVVLAAAPQVSVEIRPAGALLAETLLTFFWVFTYCGTVADARSARLGGLAVGAAVAAAMYVGGPLTGAGLNPARSFGAALLGWASAENTGAWRHHWLYWLGPAVGGCLAALVHSLALWPVRGEDDVPSA